MIRIYALISRIIYMNTNASFVLFKGLYRGKPGLELKALPHLRLKYS